MNNKIVKKIFIIVLMVVAFFIIDDYKIFWGVFLMIWANNIDYVRKETFDKVVGIFAEKLD